MERQEAIDALMGTWYQRDGEFCVGEREHRESELELRDALRALGVTDQELDA